MNYNKAKNEDRTLSRPPENIIFSASSTHFCKRLSKPQGQVQLEGLDKLNSFKPWVSNP
jgi:hypothetical protein